MPSRLLPSRFVRGTHLYTPVASTIQTFLRPASDWLIGTWEDFPAEGSNFWSKLDEVTVDVGDYVYHPDVVGTFGVFLTTGANTTIKTGHTLRMSLEGATTYTATLREGTTIRATRSGSTPPSPSVEEFTLTGPEATAITAYDDLRVTLTSGDGGLLACHWIELEYPVG